MDQGLTIDLLSVLVKRGIIPKTYLRNEIIRREYKELRESGMNGREARETLAEKHFVSSKTIEFILYKPRKRTG